MLEVNIHISNESNNNDNCKLIKKNIEKKTPERPSESI